MPLRIQQNFGIPRTNVIDAGISHEMLSTFKIRPWIIKKFGESFPLHALPYHAVQTLLGVSIREQHEEDNDGSLGYAWGVTYGADESTCDDGGDFG